MTDDEEAGPEIPDYTDFSKIRAADFPEEAIASIRIRDELARFDEQTKSNTLKFIGFTAASGSMAIQAVIELEKQIIELRKEIRSLRGE